MIRQTEFRLAVGIAAYLFGAEVVARGGSSGLSPEDVAGLITQAAQRASMLVNAVMRHLPAKDRPKSARATG